MDRAGAGALSAGKAGDGGRGRLAELRRSEGPPADGFPCRSEVACPRPERFQSCKTRRGATAPEITNWRVTTRLGRSSGRCRTTCWPATSGAGGCSKTWISRAWGKPDPRRCSPPGWRWPTRTATRWRRIFGRSSSQLREGPLGHPGRSPAGSPVSSRTCRRRSAAFRRS